MYRQKAIDWKGEAVWISNSENRMEKKNVLVLGVGGNVSQGIIKALRFSQLPLKIYGACISEMSTGLYMCDESYICPFARSSEFIPWVIAFCNTHDISLILTGVEENVLELAGNAEDLRKNTRARFISSSYEQLLIGQDKLLTCRFLQENKCNYPAYSCWESADDAVSFAESVGYPVLAKPRHGKSAQGILILENQSEIMAKPNLKGYVLEEYIGNSEREYTVGCYVDKTGNLRSVIPMHRKLKNGTTVWARVISDTRIEDEARKICRAYKPVGPFNIQMRLREDGTPVCFEMNVRFSGTTAMRSRFGFEDVKAEVLEYVYDQKIDNCFHIVHGEAFRYDEEFYMTGSPTQDMRGAGKIIDFAEYKKTL